MFLVLRCNFRHIPPADPTSLPPAHPCEISSLLVKHQHHSCPALLHPRTPLAAQSLITLKIN